MKNLRARARDKKDRIKEVVNPVISQVKEETVLLKNEGKNMVDDLHACLDKNLETGKIALECAKDRLHEKITPVVDMVKEDVKELDGKAHEAADKAHEKFDEAKLRGSEKMDELKQVGSEKIEEFKHVSAEKVEELKQKSADKLDELKQKSSEKVDEFKQKSSDAIEDLKHKIDKKAS
jgi:hypothetical protein